MSSRQYTAIHRTFIAFLVCLLILGSMCGRVFAQEGGGFLGEERGISLGAAENGLTPEVGDNVLEPTPFNLETLTEPEEAVNPCSDLAELREYLADETVHLITLQADIVLEGRWGVSLMAGHPVTIETNGFSLLVKSELTLSGPIRITGVGEQPLLHLSEGGSVYSWDGEAEIVAQGNDATAIYAENLTTIGNAVSYPLTVIADGVNATAIHADQVGKFQYLKIYARGDGGVGIRLRNTDHAQLILCYIEADTAVITGNAKLGLHACAIATEPLEAVTFESAALWLWDSGYSLLQYGIWITAGERLDSLPQSMDIELMSWSEVGSTWLGAMPTSLSWDYDAAILQTPGEYVISVTPSLSTPEIVLPNLEHEKRQDIALHVVESGRQYLTYARTRQTPGTQYIAMGSMMLLSQEYEHLLWYREDDGGWAAIPICAYDPSYFSDGTPYADARFGTEGGEIRIYGLDLGTNFFFKLQTLGNGSKAETNTLYLPAGIGLAVGESGGDRDGTGQGDQGETPPPDNSPPIVLPQKPNPSGGGTRSGTVGHTAPGFFSENDHKLDNVPTPVVSDDFGQPDKPGVIEYRTPTTEEDIPFDTQRQTTSAPSAAPGNSLVTPSKLDQGRLEDLRKTQPREMTFIEGGIKLVLPTALLDALELGADQAFRVELGGDADHFTIRMFAGDREISGFSGEIFSVYIPYATDAPLSDIYCTDAQGNSFEAQAWEKGALLFHLTATGTYTIHERFEPVRVSEQLDMQTLAEQAATLDSSFPWVGFVVVGCIILTPMAALVARRVKARNNRG